MRFSGSPVTFIQRASASGSSTYTLGQRRSSSSPQPPSDCGRGDELPGVLDGTLLEVVTEGEVAAHLEERAVPRGLADVLDVRGAHALLDADGAEVRRRLLAQEVRLERHHARVHEEQVRVVEEQRCRGHRPVSVALEVSDEPAPDLRGLHQLLPSSSGRGAGGRAGGLVLGVVLGVPGRGGTVPPALELGPSMRHEPVALAQLGFLLDPALRDLVAEQPGADLEAAEPVLEPVDGERLGGAASADHRVDPGTCPRDEPEATSHADSSAVRAAARGRGRGAGGRPSGRRAAACGPA